MLRVGVEVDAGDVAGRPGLVALEQEVRAVVVRGVRAVLAVQHEIGVLVRLGLVRLGGRAGPGEHRQQRRVVVDRVVAVVAHAVLRVLDLVGTLRAHHLGQLGREPVGAGQARCLRVRVGDPGE